MNRAKWVGRMAGLDRSFRKKIASLISYLEEMAKFCMLSPSLQIGLPLIEVLGL